MKETTGRWTHLAVVYDPRCSGVGDAMVCTGPNGDPLAATTFYIDGVPFQGLGVSSHLSLRSRLSLGSPQAICSLLGCLDLF